MSPKLPHTLLELSMLLTALHKYDVQTSSFHRISEEFVKNEVLIDQSTFDTARFAPESLQSLYLETLKDEVRLASQKAAQQAKRKRSPTPPLRTLDEARKHRHLLAGLQQKTYNAYVEQMVQELEADERIFEELQKEILEIERDIVDEDKPQAAAGTTELASRSSIPGPGTKGSLADLTADTANGKTSLAVRAHAEKLSSTSVAKEIPSEPQQLASISTKAGLPDQLSQQPDRTLASGTAKSNETSSIPDSTRALTQQAQQTQSTPKKTPIPQQPSKPTNEPGPSHIGTPNPQNAYFGTFQFTPTAQVPNRGPLPASFTPLPLPAKLFGPFTPRRRAQDLTPLETGNSSTKWKATARDLPREGRSPPRPGNSPYLSDSPSPESSRQDSIRVASQEPLRETDTPTRGGRGRGRWPTRGRGRGGRPAAGSPGLTTRVSETRIRSQSAVSGTDEATVETNSRLLKTEPPATPSFADEPTSFISTPGETRPGARRRDQLRDGETPKPSLKRKRADTAEGTPEVSGPPKFSRPGQVLASRNFPRVVSALFNDINSHKLASVFAKPLTEKSAPGYQSLIYRPQDLKSIRSAITVASRFVAQIPDPETNIDDAGGDTPATPSAATTKATNIWIDRTAEVIPPKGIVNSAQLEKELCRMLANAVMYNPDPKRGFGPSFVMTKSGRDHDEDDKESEDGLDDGRLVHDAREMFDSVEVAVAAWRKAERINSGDGPGRSGAGEKAEETADDGAENTGAEDVDGEKSASRRRTRG